LLEGGHGVDVRWANCTGESLTRGETPLLH
jgi:hypothetical protein